MYCNKSYVTMIFLSRYLSSSLYYSDIFRMWVTDFPQSKTIVKQGGSLQGCIVVSAFIFAFSLTALWEHTTIPLCKFQHLPWRSSPFLFSFFLIYESGEHRSPFLSVLPPPPISRPISLLMGTSPAVARERQTQAFEVAKTEPSQRRLFSKVLFHPIVKGMPKAGTCCHLHGCLQGNLFSI